MKLVAGENVQEQFSPVKAETATAWLLRSAPPVRKRRAFSVDFNNIHKARTKSTSQKGNKNQSNQLMPSYNDCRRDKMLSDLVACLKLAGFLRPVSKRVRVHSLYVHGCLSLCVCVYMSLRSNVSVCMSVLKSSLLNEYIEQCTTLFKCQWK